MPCGQYMVIFIRFLEKKDTCLHVVDLVDEASGGELVQKEEVARVAVHNQDGKKHSHLTRGEGVTVA